MITDYIIMPTCATHDDVIKWKHFPRYWPSVRGIHRSRWIPSQRPVTRSFDVFFDQRMYKRLSKQLWCWWFETPSWSLWRHRNEYRAQHVKLTFPQHRKFHFDEFLSLDAPKILKWQLLVQLVQNFVKKDIMTFQSILWVLFSAGWLSPCLSVAGRQQRTEGDDYKGW